MPQKTSHSKTILVNGYETYATHLQQTLLATKHTLIYITTIGCLLLTQLNIILINACFGIILVSKINLLVASRMWATKYA